MRNKFLWKGVALLTAALGMTGAFSFASFATETIANVSMTFRDDGIYVGSTEKQMELEGFAEGYYVEGNRAHAGNLSSGAWANNISPLFTVSIKANEGYEFNTAKLYSDDTYYTLATTSGRGVTFIRGTGSNKAITLTVQLDKITLDPGSVKIEDLEWAETGKAKWRAADIAQRYDVQLWRSGAVPIVTLESKSTTVSLAKYITSAGKYYFQVRAVTGGGNGDWYWSDDLYVAEADLPRYAAAAGSETPTTPTSPATPGSWRKDHVGWWFSNPDGSYPANAWKMIDGVWYFFNGSGYMESNRWVESSGKWYYLGASGGMLVNTTTPDGYRVDANGVWMP